MKSAFLPLALTVAAPAACAPSDRGEKVVNVYTARHYDSDLALYERFTRETCVKVNRIEGKPDELVARMKAEGDGSPADLFIAADAGALWRAQQAGLFQPVSSQVLEARIPANLRDPEGAWYGFSRRARVVAYDAARVKPGEVDDYNKLADAVRPAAARIDRQGQVRPVGRGGVRTGRPGRRQRAPSFRLMKGAPPEPVTWGSLPSHFSTALRST